MMMIDTDRSDDELKPVSMRKKRYDRFQKTYGYYGHFRGRTIHLMTMKDLEDKLLFDNDDILELFAARVPISFGNYRIEPIGISFSSVKLIQLILLIYRTDLPIVTVIPLIPLTFL
jgi:hypothetical protein